MRSLFQHASKLGGYLRRDARPIALTITENEKTEAYTILTVVNTLSVKEKP
jgi:hypothetical protein